LLYRYSLFTLTRLLRPLLHHSNSISQLSVYHEQEDEDEKAPLEIAPVEDLVGIASAEDVDATFSTLSSPSKYFALLAIFVLVPVGAAVYFFGGGKERVRRYRTGKGRGYSKMDLGA
jgi:hypothetical protein